MRRSLARRSRLTRAVLKITAALLCAVVVAVASYPLWRPVAKRWKWFVVATNVYQDSIRRFHLSTDQIGNPYTTPPDEREIPAHLDRIDAIYSMYLTDLGLSPSDLHGKTVLEIGPGNDAGVALRFIADGADRAIALDKFVPFQTSSFHRSLYRALRDRLTPDGKRRFDRALDLTDGVMLKPGPLSYVYGRGIEDADAVLPPGSVDIIASNAVMEEVYRIDEAWAALHRIWRPGGSQVHKIDLSDYGMFSKYGFHPLEFLTIPDGVYRFMSESVGAPNRRRVDYYRDRMAAFGYDATIYTTWLLGHDREFVPPEARPQVDTRERSRTIASIAGIRPRLLARYQALSDEDLMVQGILLVARRPAGISSRRAARD